jgi:hypothetical protein
MRVLSGRGACGIEQVLVEDVPPLTIRPIGSPTCHRVWGYHYATVAVVVRCCTQANRPCLR